MSNPSGLAATATRATARALVVALAIGACTPTLPTANPTGPAPSGAAAGSPVIRRLPDLSVPRAAFTANTLLDGRVLLAGGFGSDTDSRPQTTEIFDPTSLRFVPGPDMSNPRLGHSATLLADGRVLIAGGIVASGDVLDSAELFDPATGTFTPTGRMLAKRADHEAVRLTDGRVLLIGGTGPAFDFLSSAEIYDPRTGTFSPTGSLAAPKEAMTATLLPDGWVLVTGGHNGRHAAITIFASTELFDPASGTFSAGPEMSTRRHKHDAVALVDGRVLVLGGSDERDDAGRYTSTELFDPATRSFSEGPEMAAPRYKFRLTSVLLPDGRVLVAGGAEVPELLDPLARGFTSLGGNLGREPLFAVAAALPDGGVLLAGGYSLTGPASAAAWLFSP